MAVLDRLTSPLADLMKPPRGMEFDFSRPSGEAALTAPDSISWRIFKNPVTLFVGGVAAVILELAEPSVRSGVWNHSTFRSDALTRLRRTGAAAMMTVYGPRRDAERMISRVVKIHDRVKGVTPNGTSYRANDPRLLDWVQATASFGFIEAYSRFARPLTQYEMSQAFLEAAPAARLYGAMNAPYSTEQWSRMLAAYEPTLERSGIIFEFLQIMGRVPIARAASPLQRLLVRAAVDVVPYRIREKLALSGYMLGRTGGALVRGFGRLADAVPIQDAPPAQASIRMGLPPTFLYRR